MREGIGSTFLYNMIIVFIVVIFAILAGTLTYHKAFKVNTRIINAIEQFEGYNDLARDEIDRTLASIGYPSRDAGKCPSTKNGGQLQPIDRQFRYCVYFFNNDGDSRHYTYGVITYITFDFPIFDTFLSIPIFTKSNRIFRFNT